MPYGPWDEQFVHQLPRTLDHVHDSEPSWSDRCYFNVHAPDALAVADQRATATIPTNGARTVTRSSRWPTAGTGTSMPSGG